MHREVAVQVDLPIFFTLFLSSRVQKQGGRKNDK